MECDKDHGKRCPNCKARLDDARSSTIAMTGDDIYVCRECNSSLMVPWDEIRSKTWQKARYLNEMIPLTALLTVIQMLSFWLLPAFGIFEYSDVVGRSVLVFFIILLLGSLGTYAMVERLCGQLNSYLKEQDLLDGRIQLTAELKKGNLKPLAKIKEIEHPWKVRRKTSWMKDEAKQGSIIFTDGQRVGSEQSQA